MPFAAVSPRASSHVLPLPPVPSPRHRRGLRDATDFPIASRRRQQRGRRFVSSGRSVPPDLSRPIDASAQSASADRLVQPSPVDRRDEPVVASVDSASPSHVLLPQHVEVPSSPVPTPSRRCRRPISDSPAPARRRRVQQGSVSRRRGRSASPLPAPASCRQRVSEESSTVFNEQPYCTSTGVYFPCPDRGLGTTSSVRRRRDRSSSRGRPRRSSGFISSAYARLPSGRDVQPVGGTSSFGLPFDLPGPSIASTDDLPTEPADGLHVGFFSGEQAARRREIKMGKRPLYDVAGDVRHTTQDRDSVPWTTYFGASSSVNDLPDDSSEDDNPAGWPFGLNDGLCINSNSVSRSYGLPRWAPLPRAFSSGLTYSHGDVMSHSAGIHAGSSTDLHENDLPAVQTLRRPAAATPFVPRHRVSTNRQMRNSIRQHRALLKAGFQPGNVELPLPADFVALLKRAWPGRSYYGPPHHLCRHCGACFWYEERCTKLSTKKQVVYTRCCRGGKISLPIYPRWPSPLVELLRFDGGPVSNRFMCMIREYNSMFAFTSLGVHVDKSECWDRSVLFQNMWSSLS